MADTTEQRLAKADQVIEQVLGIRPSEQDGRLGVHDIPSWDSLKHVDLMLALDSALDIGVSADTAARLLTLDAIRDYARAGGANAVAEPTRSQDIFRGLRGVAFDDTELCQIAKNGAELRYRGYRIEDLASADFCETIHLLVLGELPTGNALRELASDISASAPPGDLQRRIIRESGGTNPMGALAAAFAIGEVPRESAIRPEIALLSELVQLAGAFGQDGGAPAGIGDGPMAISRFLLRRLTGRDPVDVDLRALNACLVIQAEHGANASSFALRVARSAGASPRASIVAGLATFSGGLHGGAVLDVVRMLDEIGEPDRARRHVRDRAAAGRPVPGFGHGVYAAEDPRAPILRRIARDVAAFHENSRWLDMMDAIVEELRPQAEYGVCANVDAFLGVVFATLGVPRGLESVVFSCGRIAGWLAHAAEQSRSNILIRPQLRYAGPEPRPFQPVDRRAGPRNRDEGG